jgi:predicted AAA+ superfamily ATPase
LQLNSEDKNEVDLSAIELQNIRMWINRKYEKTITKLFGQFPIVVLTGARQVGKTALVQKVFLEFPGVTGSERP